MKTIVSKFILASVMVLGLQSTAFGANVHNSELSSVSSLNGSNRTDHRYGIYTSFLGEPFGLVGVNIARNATDFLRSSLGFGIVPEIAGKTVGAYSIGAGLKLVVPNWNFTPVVGTNISFVMVRGGGSGFVHYENIGLEYTSSGGFHIGAGVNTLFVVAGNTAAADSVLPYLNVGVFF